MAEEAVNVMCPECGALIEVHDVRAVLLAMHLTNECSELSGLFPVRSGE